ncbi:MAG: hypothetical protein N838_04660 [Thiohalocapsa sp. PB-PSB1]|nr:MAG: hypothetical protein N838_04660 [Thiohalocapsa sp. PB-PSB1]
MHPLSAKACGDIIFFHLCILSHIRKDRALPPIAAGKQRVTTDHTAGETDRVAKLYW